MTQLFAVGGWLWMVNVGHAAEPTVDRDGTVCVRVVLPASEAEVRQQLDSGAKTTALAQAARLIDRQPSGKCEKLTYKTPGMIGSLTYVTLRCPTAQGWKETLVSGEGFEDNSSEWELREVEGGTELNYRVRVRMSLPVGQSLVNSRVAQTMKSAIERLEERLRKFR